MIYMNNKLIIWDTEYTTWPSAQAVNWGSPGQHREVFQIAALAWTRGQPWRDAPAFNRLARPVVNPILSAFATTLTGVTQRQLEEEGAPLQTVLDDFARFCGPLNAWSNGNDINPVAESCGLQRVLMPLDPRRCRSLRPALYAALEAETGPFDHGEYPSGRVYERLALTLPTAQAHNALHDVYSLAATVEELERRGHDLGLWTASGMEQPAE